jgi:hypothetical protein
MALHRRKDLPPYDPELYLSILRTRDAFLMPERVAGSGQFPRSKPRVVEGGRAYPFEGIRSEPPPCFGSYERGIALLRISLAMQTLTALERAGLEPGTAVFTEGGFRRDEAYNLLVSAALRDNRVFLTDIAEASAFGAAMTAKMALGGKKLKDLAGDFEIDYQEVEKKGIPEIFSYRASWLDYTEYE